MPNKLPLSPGRAALDFAANCTPTDGGSSLSLRYFLDHNDTTSTTHKTHFCPSCRRLSNFFSKFASQLRIPYAAVHATALTTFALLLFLAASALAEDLTADPKLNALLEHIRAAHKLPVEDLITAKLFKPLEMKSAGFGGIGTFGKIDQPSPHPPGNDAIPRHG